MGTHGDRCYHAVREQTAPAADGLAHIEYGA
jgi:hypothetical protein